MATAALVNARTLCMFASPSITKRSFAKVVLFLQRRSKTFVLFFPKGLLTRHF